MSTSSIPHDASGPRQRARFAREARLTKRMKDLPATLLKVLVELRYHLFDGESAMISNAMVARWTGISEGRISYAMRQLAGETCTTTVRGKNYPYPGVGPFITRVLQDGGGYQITMLAPDAPPPATPAPPAEATYTPPPEAAQLSIWPDLVPLGDHEHDPLSEVPRAAPPRAAARPEGDHAHDPSILLYTTAKQQQQQAAPAHEQSAEPSNQLYADLLALSANVEWSRAIAARTDITSIQQIQEQIQIARDLGKRSPQGWVLARLAGGGGLLLPPQPSTISHRPSATSVQPSRPKPQPAPTWRRVTDEEVAHNDRCWARLRALFPAGFEDLLEEGAVILALLDGSTDEEAIARLEAYREEQRHVDD